MNIDFLFKLKSLAVVGASPGSYFSDRLFEHLCRLKGRVSVYPVNSRRKSVYKMKCFSSLGSLKGKCSAAFLLVDETRSIELLKECAKNGMKAAVMLSTAAHDKRGMEELSRVAEKSDITLLGPGSLGYIDTQARLTIYAGRLPSGPLPSGRVSIVSESGGLLNEFFRVAGGELKWGVRRAISVGQQAVLTTGLALKHLVDDALTGCIVLLLTGVKDSVSLLAAIDEACLSGKSVVIFPAFLSNGASIRFLESGATDTSLYKEMLMLSSGRRGGVFLTESVEEAAAASGALAPGGMERAGQGLPARWKRIRGKKVALLSVSGGIGGWMKTRASDFGLKVPAFSRKLREDLSNLFPGESFTNPVDLSGKILSSSGDFKKVLGTMVHGSGCHAVVVSMHPPSGDTPSDRRNEKWLGEIEEVEIESKRDKSAAALVPVQVSRGGPPAIKGGWIEASPVVGLDLAYKLIGWAAGLDKIDFPEERKEHPGGTDYEAARSLLRGPARRLSGPSSRKVLGCYGIDFPEWVLAGSQSKAVGFLRRVKGPVNLKLATPDIEFNERDAFSRFKVRGESAVKKAYVDLLVDSKKSGRDMKILGILVELHDEDAAAVEVATLSTCAGSPPVIILWTGRGGQMASGICPAGPGEASTLVQEILNGKYSRFEPVKMSEITRRLSLFASDFKEEVSQMRCRFTMDGQGRVLCTQAEVVINKTVQ